MRNILLSIVTLVLVGTYASAGNAPIVVETTMWNTHSMNRELKGLIEKDLKRVKNIKIDDKRVDYKLEVFIMDEAYQEGGKTRLMGHNVFVIVTGSRGRISYTTWKRIRKHEFKLASAILVGNIYKNVFSPHFSKIDQARAPAAPPRPAWDK